MPRPKKTNPAAPKAGDAIASIKYPAKRKNIPPAGLEAQGVLQEALRIRYEFNPDKSKWSKLAKALGDADVFEEDAFEALSGLTSLPFPRPERLGKGETWRVAVKVIDPRGNEGLRVLIVKE